MVQGRVPLQDALATLGTVETTEPVHLRVARSRETMNVPNDCGRSHVCLDRSSLFQSVDCPGHAIARTPGVMEAGFANALLAMDSGILLDDLRGSTATAAPEREKCQCVVSALLDDSQPHRGRLGT